MRHFRIFGLFLRDSLVSLAITLLALAVVKAIEALVLYAACDAVAQDWCLPRADLPLAHGAITAMELAVMMMAPFALAMSRLWRMLKQRERAAMLKYRFLSAVLAGGLLMGLEIPVTAYQNDMLTQEMQIMQSSDPKAYDEAGKLWPHRLKMFLLAL